MDAAALVACVAIAAGLVFGVIGVFIGHNYAMLKRKCEGADMQEIGEIKANTAAVASNVSVKERDASSLHKRAQRSAQESLLSPFPADSPPVFL